MQFLEGTISENKSYISIYPPIISKERDVDFFVISNYIDLRHFSDVHCDKYERLDDTRREKEKTLSSKDNTDRRANR